MLRQDIDVNGYWLVTICYDVYLGEVNSGFTHTDFKKKWSIVAIGKSESRKQFLNTMIHELKHVQSHICGYYNVPEDGEQAAYLIGYLAMKAHRYLIRFL